MIQAYLAAKLPECQLGLFVGFWQNCANRCGPRYSVAFRISHCDAADFAVPWKWHWAAEYGGIWNTLH